MHLGSCGNEEFGLWCGSSQSNSNYGGSYGGSPGYGGREREREREEEEEEERRQKCLRELVHVILFKNWKHVVKILYQTRP